MRESRVWSYGIENQGLDPGYAQKAEGSTALRISFNMHFEQIAVQQGKFGGGGGGWFRP